MREALSGPLVQMTLRILQWQRHVPVQSGAAAALLIDQPAAALFNSPLVPPACGSAVTRELLM